MHWSFLFPAPLLAAALLAALPGNAQQPAGATLVAVRGDALEIAITPDGTVYALDQAGKPWVRRPDDGGHWRGLPGQFGAVRSGRDGSVWALSATHELYRLQGGSWWQKVGERVRDITAGPDGGTLALAAGELTETPAGGGTSRRWPLEPGYTHVLADAHGLPWLWGTDGRIARFDGTAWVRHDAAAGARSLAAGPDGGLMLVDGRGAAWRWDAAARNWQPAAGGTGLAQVALGPGGKPWFVTLDGQLLASELFAAHATARGPATFTRLLTWQRVRGSARDLSIAPGGGVLTIDGDGNLWQWKGKDHWSMLPGRLARVAAGPEGTVWGILSSGRVAQLLRGLWQEAGFDARDLAIAPGGEVWALRTDGQLMQLARGAQQWRAAGQMPVTPAAPATAAAGTPAAGGSAIAIAAGKDGEPWLLAADGTVLARQAAGWRSYPGIAAASLGVGPDGTVYATTADLAIYWLDRQEKQWKPASGRARRIAVGPRGAPWAIGEQGELLASALFLDENEQRVAQQAALAPAPRPVFTVIPAPPATVLGTSNKALAYTGVAGAFRDIGVGSDGSVFAAGTDGSLYCFDPAEKKFQMASTGSTRRVVAAGATPWTVNANGEVARFDKGWQTVADFKALDLSVAQNGSIFAVQAGSQQVHRFAAQSGAFEAAQDSSGAPFPKALKVAGVNNNMAWLIAPDQQVWRCTGIGCNALATSARDIGIGPEGSVYIIDLAGAVRRFDARAGGFKTVGGSGLEIAVGPQGLPWLVDSSGAAQASQFFAAAKGARSTACSQRFAGQPVPLAPQPAQIKANADSVLLGAGGQLDILANDSMNGGPVTAARVVVSFNGGSPYLAHANGVVSVLPGAPPGSSLSASYRLCQAPPGSGCSAVAAVTVQVPGTLAAQPDSVALLPGLSTPAGALLANDAANGRQLGGPSDLVRISGMVAPGIVVGADGGLSVAPATPPGNYAGSYRVCLAATPSICADAALAVTVLQPLSAAPDRLGVAPGQSSPAAALLANDTLAGNALSSQLGLVSVNGSVNAAGVTVSANGTVSVSLATAPGHYTGSYSVCLAAAPAICASAAITLEVAAVLVAQADNVTLAPGSASGAGALLGNDSLNGQALYPALASQVLVSGSGGAPGITVAGGVVSVAAGTAPGIYHGSYRICLAAAPSSCAAAALTTTVLATITAGDDDFVIAAGGSSGSGALLANDSVNGGPPGTGQVTLSGSFGVPGLGIGNDGSVRVTAGQAPGVYSGSYRVCVANAPAICATARVTVNVPAPEPVPEPEPETPVTPPWEDPPSGH